VFQHMSACGWWFGATWPSHGLPRGTPLLAFGLFVKMYWSSWGSTPRPPHRIAPSQILSDQRTIVYALIYIWIDIYLNSNYVINNGGSAEA
jgi:hypothetical protein